MTNCRGVAFDDGRDPLRLHAASPRLNVFMFNFALGAVEMYWEWDGREGAECKVPTRPADLVKTIEATGVRLTVDYARSEESQIRWCWGRFDARTQS
jgi:hypothetical protein